MMETVGKENFGMLLRTFRNRRGIKQLALAYRIGKKNRASIDSWERGLYLPKQRETVLALAHALQLSERETNQLLIAADFPPEYELPQSHDGQNLESLKQRYLAWVQDLYEYMDMGGISPRVASRAGARTIKIRMEDVFISMNAFNPPHIHLPTEEEWAMAAQGERGNYRYPWGDSWDSAIANFRPKSTELLTILENQRVVVLGHPGMGKTTFGKYIAYALASNNRTLIGNRLKDTVPLLIRAADYGKAIQRDEALSFYRYITSTLYTDHFGPVLAWALEHNRCLVIIDGLDEISDPLWRNRVTQKIEQFVSEYRENHFVVTSRLAGYRENQLTGNFIHMQLVEWDEPQIVDYLEKWYQTINEKTSPTIVSSSKQRAQRLWEAIQARKGVRQLAGVPLLLMIIALVDQYGGKLPERRVEVYQLATETLLSYWPFYHREQQIDSQEMLQILGPIAYHIFTQSEDRLITEYEFRSLFEEQVRRVWGTDARKTRIRSARLLCTIEEHTGFFLRRGTNEHGQELYGFLHPTFAEYLTAYYLAERWEKERVLEIADSVHEPTWHEVVLLMAGYLGTLMPVLATRLVEYIEQLPSAFDDLLHRNLLLVAEIIGDNVPLERWKRDEIIFRLLSLALETNFEPLWTAIVNRLKRLARLSLLAQLPDLLKQYENDLPAVGVRKVILARCLGFSKETDLCFLVRGLFEDEMTCRLAKTILRAEFQLSERKQYTSTHICFIRFTMKGEMSLVGPIGFSQKVAACLRKLPLPVRDDVGMLGTVSSLTSIGEIWLLDRAQLLKLGAPRLAILLAACQKLDYFLVMILTRMIKYSPSLQTLLPAWIKQAAEQTVPSEERILALNALKEIFQYSKPSEREENGLHPFRAAIQAIIGAEEDPYLRSSTFSVAWRISNNLEEQRNILLKGLSDPSSEVRITVIHEAHSFLSRRSPQHIATESLMLKRLWELTVDPLPEVCIASMRVLFYCAPTTSAANIFYLVNLLCNQSLTSLTQYSISKHIIDLLRLAYLLDTSDVFLPIGKKIVTLIEQMAMETGAAARECEGLPRDIQTIGFSSLLSVQLQESLARQLSPLLQNSEARVRCLAATIWAVVFNSPLQTPAILSLIKDPDTAVRSAAFDALSEADLVEPGVLATLQHALREDETRVKRAILRRIEGYMKNRLLAELSSSQAELLGLEVVDRLLEVLSDEEPGIAYQAASLLVLAQEPVTRQRIITAVGVKAAKNLSTLYVLWGLVMPTETS